MNEDLKNLANKIRMMFGKHPDAELIDAAAARIEELEAEVAAKTTTKRTTKKKAAADDE